MQRGYIYKITNTINGKFYIGSRRCNSLEDAKQDKYFGSGLALAKAIKKHGVENFNKKIIALVDNAYEYEELILQNINAAKDPQSYNLKNSGSGGMCGYVPSIETRLKVSRSLLRVYKNPQLRIKLSNARMGANNHFYGKHHTKETRDKFSQIRKGSKLTNAHRENISAGLLGHTHNSETRAKISKNHVRYWSGKKFNKNTCTKISEALIGRKFTAEHLKNMSLSLSNPVQSISMLDGSIIGEFYGANEAERKTDVGHSLIIACCKGKRKNAGVYCYKENRFIKVSSALQKVNKLPEFAVKVIWRYANNE